MNSQLIKFFLEVLIQWYVKVAHGVVYNFTKALMMLLRESRFSIVPQCSMKKTTNLEIHF